jgi:hypothetical protein
MLLLLFVGFGVLFFAIRATRRARRAQMIAFVAAGVAVQALVLWRLGVLERLRETFPR